MKYLKLILQGWGKSRQRIQNYIGVSAIKSKPWMRFGFISTGSDAWQICFKEFIAFLIFYFCSYSRDGSS